MQNINSSELDNLVLLINNYCDEKQRRMLLGAAAKVYGYGGFKHISELTGIAYTTLAAGVSDAANSTDAGSVKNDRIRKEGGGRKPITEHYPGLKTAIEEIVDGATYGSPSKVLHWVSSTLSLRKITDILAEKFGIKISYVKVSQILTELGYSKQVNQKMEQVAMPSPYRDEQFQHINDTASDYMTSGDPVISVDTKKKENVGNFKNNGSEYRKEKDPRRVLDHDFPIKELGKVAPYGVYVLNDNTGFINLGTDHDTAEFAVESIFRWWDALGKESFPEAKRIYITCDGGGSNGSRSRLWKQSLQDFADRTGLDVEVSHYPPGTSKWNKVEHRMFCFISKSWQGQPLVDIETIVELITKTTTKGGLRIACQVDKNIYPTGKKVGDEAFAKISIYPATKLGEWNYVIKPRIMS